jgi:hypothetical protein
MWRFPTIPSAVPVGLFIGGFIVSAFGLDDDADAAGPPDTAAGPAGAAGAATEG